MKKSTKGVLAASAAAVVLMGGAGSLAYWTDSVNIPGGTIETGELKLAAGATNSCTSTDWELKTGASSTVPLGTTNKLVPGDELTKTCNYKVVAKGKNLKATLTVPQNIEITPTTTSASFQMPVVADIQLNNAAIAAGPGNITEANDGQTISVKLTVTMPFGTDETAGTKVNANDTQKITGQLDNAEVTLVQVANTF